MDRVVKVINPDATYKQTSFDRWTIADFDENSHRHDYVLDSYGRIINVLEYNIHPDMSDWLETYNTSYEYDTQDDLVEITDNEGNEFRFTYDSLGRKVKLEDPDLGIWKYGYDANSNLVFQNDSKGNEIRLGYDELNRILEKNSTDINISFSYDGAYWGTLSNITQGNIIFRYSYDKRMRIINEEAYLGGAWISTGMSYDSMNRILEQRLPSTDLEYYYNKQGKVRKINDYITAANYNAFGSLANRTYANSLISRFSYDPSNNRLSSIITGNLQNLAYAYDKVGNILSIDDSASARTYRMGYDGLDRLINTTINNDLYQYEYDPIGNIKRIVRPSGSKRLVYTGRIPHAPSQVIDTDAGTGIYNARDMDTGSKNRVFEFFIVKESLGNISNANMTLKFGDGSSASGVMNVSSPILAIIQNNYSNGGLYLVNFSTDNDANLFSDKFGVDAKSLSLITNNRSIAYMEFMIESDIAETALNAQWNCSNGIGSANTFNITNSTMVIIEYNYSSPGNKDMLCSVNSADGSGNKSTEFEIKGLEIENYDLVSVDTNKKVAIYDVKNYYDDLIANISTSSQEISPSKVANISSDGFVMALVELNYTSDGDKAIDANAISGNIAASYHDSFNIKALDIENYDRHEFNNTQRIISFDLYNRWPQNLSVGWNISDPAIRNSTYLNQSESVMVIIEEDYSSQGRKEPEIRAYSGSLVSRMKDKFNIYFVRLLDLQVLKGSVTETVSELIARSHSGNRNVSWVYDTGAGIIPGNYTVSINESQELMVLVESNYTDAGIYRINASVNSSGFRDDSKGVVSGE